MCKHFAVSQSRVWCLRTLALGLLFARGVAVGAPSNDLARCIAKKVVFDGSMPLHYENVAGRTGTRLYLHAEFPSHCAPSNQAACRSNAYVVPGDTVAKTKSCNGWAYVQYIGETHTTVGWAAAQGLIAIPRPPHPVAPVAHIGDSVPAPATGRHYHFVLTKGLHRAVCEAYLQRLNQTEFFDPPYCGRPESTVVPGFAELHRRYLSASRYWALLPQTLNVLRGDPPYYGYTRRQNPDGTETLVPPRAGVGVPDEFQPGAWLYDPPIDIENSGNPDNVFMWTDDDDRGLDPCGAPNGHNGAPIRSGPGALILSSDGRSVDPKKTDALFGRSDLAQYSSGGVPVETGTGFGILEYRGVIYFDAFFSGSEGDFDGRRAGEPHLSDTLGVFLERHGTRHEMCEYYVPDEENQP